MNKYENDEYIESLISKDDNSKVKKHRRTWKTVTAVVLAGVLAVTGAFLCFGSQDSATASAVTLTYSTAQDDAQQISGQSYYLVDATQIVNEVLPSVVSITTREMVNYYNNYGFYGGGLGDLWDYFFGDSYGGRGEYFGGSYGGRNESSDDTDAEEETEEPEEIESAMGSGTIIAQNDTELLILTSFHVVEGSSSLYVTFINDESVDGYVKAADEDKDIAIVAIPLENINEDTMNSIKIASVSTEEPVVGEGVLVIGNALGYGISVTTGIVSAVDREIYVEGRTLTVIQTDAAINQGNSGGCMINSKGEVIGISEAKVTVSYVEGMCYAIPVVSNLDIIEELINAEGTYEENKNNPSDANGYSNGAYLGIRGRDVTSDAASNYGMPLGVYVASCVEGSGAQDAGILSGDIIVGMDGTEITTMDELQYELSLHGSGDTVSLDIKRLVNGEYTDMTVDVTLTDRIS